MYEEKKFNKNYVKKESTQKTEKASSKGNGKSSKEE
jgi:hypothetical protein